MRHGGGPGGLALLLTLGASALLAAGPATAAAPRGAAQYAALFDGLVPRQLAEHGIPGATIAVVDGGEIAFARGYGVADLATSRPVDPERTLFRIASITKVFTWIAGLQLAERGLLDLHADVNRYLGDLRLPDTYPAPVTFAHLMTHTAGLEDGFIGVAARCADEVVPLAVYLERRRAPRVRPVGEVSAYSNYGGALAGRILELASGESYDALLEGRILGPLGMSRTTAREPLPAALAADLAASYEPAGDGLRRVPFTFDNARPEGSMSSTAADMARLMIAILDRGRHGEARLFGEATARLVLTPQFKHHARLLGLSYGFFEGRLNDEPILQHSGGWEGFVSWIALAPRQNLGLFVSYNADGGHAAFAELKGAFADRFFPAAPVAPLAPRPELAAAAARLAGEYRPTRGQYQNMLKLSRFLESERVDAAGPGVLEFDGRRWIAEAPDLFRAADRRAWIAFRTDAGGRPTYLFAGFGSYERVPWHETTPVQIALLGGCAAAFLAVAGAALIRAIRRRKAAPGSAPGWHAWARRVAVAAALLDLAFLVCAFVFDASSMVFGVSAGAVVAIAATWASALLAAASAAFCAALWRGGSWPRAARLRYTGALAAQAGFVAFLAIWHIWPVPL